MTTRRLQSADERVLAAACAAAVLFGRDDRIALVATGADRRRFLHAMLSAHVAEVADNDVRRATLCDAQGRMTAVVELVHDADRIVLWCDRRDSIALVDALERFVITDDVAFALDEELALVSVVGPRALVCVAALGMPAPDEGRSQPWHLAGEPTVTGQTWLRHVRGIDEGARPWTLGSAAAPFASGPTLEEVRFSLARSGVPALVEALCAVGAEIGCHSAWDALRILAGEPILALDIADGSTPLEAGLRDAVAFDKGCYLGQEAIVMMAHRGQLRRHLCWVTPLAPGVLPAAGSELRDAMGKRAGTMGSGVLHADGSGRGLALVQRKRFARGAVLSAGDESDGASVCVLDTTIADAFSTLADGGG